MAWLISEKYEVLTKVGQGGMGAVYKARHSVLDAIYALKLLPSQLADDPDLIARFQREARVMAQLNHANIVKVLDLARDGELYYLVEEFVEGQNLDQYIKSRGALPVRDALDIARQVADALAYSHGKGVIHRDIKPSNILLESTPPFRAKIADFGIAKVDGVGDRTQTGQMLGSLRYSAPEQLGYRGPRGKRDAREKIEADGRADVYALGLCVFEMCEGRALFADLEPQEILAQLLVDVEPIEPSFTRVVPDSVNDLVARAIHRHPDERYQGMTEFLREIEHCLDDLNKRELEFDPLSDAPTRISDRESVVQLEDAERPLDTLEIERQRKSVLAVQAEARAAELSATRAHADELAASLFRRGRTEAEKGEEALRLARYDEAETFFARSRELLEQSVAAATTASAVREAAQAVRKGMLEARARADHAAAADWAGSLYGRATALEKLGDEHLAHRAHVEAQQAFSEAQRFYAEAAQTARDAPLRQEIQQARRVLDEARAVALQARAPQLATAAFQQAASVEAKADFAVTNGDLAAAKDLIASAIEAYRQAHASARAASGEAGDDTATRVPGADDALTQAPTRLWKRVEADSAPQQSASRAPSASADATKVRGRGQDDRRPPTSAPDLRLKDRNNETRIQKPSDVVAPRPTVAQQPEQGERRTWLLAVVGVTTIMLGVAGFYAFRVVTAPGPLTWADVQPANHKPSVMPGKPLRFSAGVQEPDRHPDVHFSWILDGQERAVGGSWEYQPGHDEGGANREVTVVASLGDQRIQQSWQVRIERDVTAPSLVAEPTDDRIAMAPRDEKRFSVSLAGIADAQRDQWTYTWERNGQWVQSGPQVAWTLHDATAKDREVRVTVNDATGARIGSHAWTVEVANRAPKWVSAQPKDRLLPVEQGSRLPFTVEASDPGEDDALKYTWFVDGEKAGDGSRWIYEAPSREGKHAIQVEVSDPEGLAAVDRQAWTVEINPNPPKIVFREPSSERVELTSGRTTRFSVRAKIASEAGDPRFEWLLDDKLQSVHGNSFDLPADLSAGRHNVQVAAIDPSGTRTTDSWSINVRPDNVRPDVNPTPRLAAVAPAVVPTPVSQPPAELSHADMSEWLSEFKSAFVTKNAAQLVAIGAIPVALQKKYEDNFDKFKAYTVSTSNESIQIEESKKTGTITFDRTDSDERGPMGPPRKQTYRLEKRQQGPFAIQRP